MTEVKVDIGQVMVLGIELIKLVAEERRITALAEKAGVSKEQLAQALSQARTRYDEAKKIMLPEV